MKYTEPEGVEPDYLFFGKTRDGKVKFNRLLERWDALAKHKVGIEELKIMLNESSTTLHQYSKPRTDPLRPIEKAQEEYLRRLGFSYDIDYDAPDNLYVTKEDLIKAEIFHDFRKEIKVPEKNKKISYTPKKFKADTRKFADKGVRAFIESKGYSPRNSELWEYLKSYEHESYVAKYVKKTGVFIIEQSPDWDRDAFNKFYSESFTIDVY